MTISTALHDFFFPTNYYTKSNQTLKSEISQKKNRKPKLARKSEVISHVVWRRRIQSRTKNTKIVNKDD